MGDVKDPATGVCFPASQTYWHGGELKSLGAGARVRKIGFLTVKVYAVSLYVDPAGAAAAGGQNGFTPGSEAAAAGVLKHGTFTQVLQIHLVRDVTGQQFSETLDESLRPVMRACGDEAALDKFCGFLQGKQMASGTQVLLMRCADGTLDVALQAVGAAAPPTSAGVSIASPQLSKAIWESYLGDKPPAPDALRTWLAALPALLVASSK